MGDEHRRELFDAIERQGERARLLVVNNLLELSQLEAGSLKVDPVTIDAAEAAERAAELLPPPDGVSLEAMTGPAPAGLGQPRPAACRHSKGAGARVPAPTRCGSAERSVHSLT